MTTTVRAPGWNLGNLAAPLGSAAALVGTVAALHFRDPHQQFSWGVCPVYLATGLYCPGCGGLRAVNDVTNGDVVAALGSNPLIFPAGIVLAWLWLAWLGKRVGFRFPSVPTSKWLWIPVGLAVIAWTVVRNLPGSVFAP